MRVVLDTNVVLSALLWRGTPHRSLVAMAEHPRIQLYSSVALAEELPEMLARPFATNRLALS